jgi:hypothetical protein
VACQYAGAGCDQRGPARKMREHQTDCAFRKEGGRLFFTRDSTSFYLKVLKFFFFNVSSSILPFSSIWMFFLTNLTAMTSFLNRLHIF